MKCQQKCDSASENLDRFSQGIGDLISTLEEWKSFASSTGALPHVESTRGYSQMVSPQVTKCLADSNSAHSLLQNEVLQNTLAWIRGFHLTVQALSIAHSTAGQIAYDLTNDEHSDERVRMGSVCVVCCLLFHD